ncbi:MAG: hypothetical protein PVH46_02205 [Granulosicoccaceae bacterium]|jgi:hypothetical protein
MNKQLFSGLLWLMASTAIASSGHAPRNIEYGTTPDAPAHQTWGEADRKSAGCVSCHTDTDRKTMHANPAVVLGCTDCHGGDAGIHKPENAKNGDAAYRAMLDKAHVQPLYPEQWNYPSSANPELSYTLLNKESPEFIRFVNPGDLRVAREACGACHLPIIQASERSIMATGAMLWGGAAYNNGILPFKRYILGEAYTRDGEPASLVGPVKPDDDLAAKGVIAQLYPMPTWETIPPGDIFRVFERGGRNITNLFPETGLPNSLGRIQQLEEPGRPDIKQSNRGPGTGLRIAVPVINIHKTRLNDPFLWFLGTNNVPGDFRSSGCSSCHVVYANDRDPRHSGPYAQYGHMGKTQTVDPTIPKDEPGHPLKHEFSRAIPTSLCMNCHMHQPNVFVNSYLGYTMWDYEADAPHMWPEQQQYPSHAETRQINKHNPEEAAIRGKWNDREFLKKVWELNPKLKDTQFADYHGHGWNFRAIFKRDRKGNMLDADGNIVDENDPEWAKKAVLMSSIHLDKGMHCVDCHFAQDAHGNGHIYGEVAQAVEIDCIDCHGTADEYPTLKTSGPAAPPGGNDLALLRTPTGKKRFEWQGEKLIQRSSLWPDREWEVSLVRDNVNPNHPTYNAKSARAKLMSNDRQSFEWGPGVAPEDRAHKNEDMLCFTCHSSWATSCAGCHLPIQANWKTERHHYEGGETRNYATYNPQVVRDQMYQLGKHGPAKGGRIAPVRSSSALVLSSRNINRELIYIQQPPIASSGYSSQAFAPHFPHTTRKTETKTCTDCHLSESNDNNAIMAQLLLLGTNYVNFVGYYGWFGTDGEIVGQRVTEWDEPQAVIGSYLQKYAFPDWFKEHKDRNNELPDTLLYQATHESGYANCIQMRGEYLYVAEGKKGTRAYDIAGIANKGVSQRIITAPFSELGHDTHVESKNATCVVLPTNQPIHAARNRTKLNLKTNMEQPMHAIYDNMYITDSEEGLIVVDVNTLANGEPRDNFLSRKTTWNENGVLDGASHLTIGGYYFYITTPKAVVVLNMDDPGSPKLVTTIPMNNPRGTALQFRYLFVTDDEGFKVIDVTHPGQAKLVDGAFVPLKDAQRIYVARTYAYVAAKQEGLAIIDVEKAEQPELYMQYTADGQLNDARDVVVASTNASAFAYVADGKNGIKILQLTSPDSQPLFYGFSPAPQPELIAYRPTRHTVLSVSKGLDRDRAVDETGGQIAIFGRIGSRPFTLEEMHKLYLDEHGAPYFVTDEVREQDFVPLRAVKDRRMQQRPKFARPKTGAGEAAGATLDGADVTSGMN